MAFVGPLIGLLGATSLGSLSIAGGVWGSIGARLLASVALSALSRALQPKPSAPGLKTDQTLTGGTVPESFVLGAFATHGVFAAPALSQGSSGKTPLAYYTQVIEVAGLPGHTLEGLLLDGEAVSILDDDPHADYGKRIGGRFEGYAWIKYYDGTQVAADPMLVAKYPVPYVRPWLSTHVGAGICYAILTTLYNPQIFKVIPKPLFILRGAHRLDPRTEVSAQSDNAALLIWHGLRGIPLPSGDVWGGGIAEDDLPAAVWEAAMDACESDGAWPGYRASLEMTVDEEPFAVIEDLLKACSGRLTDVGGEWQLIVGPPPLPSLFLTDASIIADAPEDYAPFPAPDQVFNAISATYTDPAQQWRQVETPLNTNAGWEGEDGKRLPTGLQLRAVTNSTAAIQIAGELIADHRRMIRHTVTLPPALAALLTPGDTISWTSDQNGYAAKTFEATRVERDIRTQLVRVSLREVDADDWSPITIPDLPDPPTSDPVIAGPQEVVAFDVEPWTLSLSGVQRRAGFLATWAPDGADDARGVRVAYRQNGDTGDGSEHPLVPVSAGGVTVSENLTAGVWQVRARYDVDRATVWTAWISVTVEDWVIPLSVLDADIRGWLDELDDWISGGVLGLPSILGVAGAQIRTLAERVNTLALELDETVARNHLGLIESRRFTGRVEQRFSVRLVEVEGGVALVSQALTEVEAQLNALDGDVEATATALSALSATVTSQGDDITALSDSLTSVTAAVDDVSAIARFRMTALTGPSGYARLGMQARVTTGDTFRTSGLYLETPTNPALPTRVVVEADQFAVLGGGSLQAPFVISGGVVYINAEAIRLTGDTTVDGTFKIQSAASGERTVITPSGMKVYDSSGTLRVIIGDLS